MLKGIDEKGWPNAMKGSHMAIQQQEGATKPSCDKQEVNNCTHAYYWIMQAVGALCDSG